jgi:DNA-directed RNA polymerase subunit M/transcription elongation factor TFIIS
MSTERRKQVAESLKALLLPKGKEAAREAEYVACHLAVTVEDLEALEKAAGKRIEDALALYALLPSLGPVTAPVRKHFAGLLRPEEGKGRPCPKCGAKAVVSRQVQLRGGDEGAETLDQCMACDYSADPGA